MKLLFDQNLSPKLVSLLDDVFPGSVHVQSASLDCASDDIPAPLSPGHWSLHNSKTESVHTLGADTNPSGICHFPEGNSANSRWSSAATPPDSVLVKSLYPVGIAAHRITENARTAGIPPGYRRLWMPETGGVAALDHRLWAVTPAGWGVV